MKPLCYMFLWAWRCTTFNSIPIILIPLTNKNVALNYSVAICQQKTKDCAPSGSFQLKLQHCCFYIWCLLSSITSLMLRGLCWFCCLVLLCWFVMVPSVVVVVLVVVAMMVVAVAVFVKSAFSTENYPPKYIYFWRQTNILLKVKASILK